MICIKELSSAAKGVPKRMIGVSPRFRVQHRIVCPVMRAKVSDLVELAFATRDLVRNLKIDKLGKTEGLELVEVSETVLRHKVIVAAADQTAIVVNMCEIHRKNGQ